MITKTGIIVPQEKRDTISAINFKDAKTYVVTKDGGLDIIHDDDVAIDASELKQAINDFSPKEKTEEKVFKKQAKDISLLEVVEVLIEKGIL